MLDSNGRYVAGVAASDLGAPAGLATGALPHRAGLGGVPSICATSPIGKDTPLDHGWTVVSCLPQTLVAPAAAFPAAEFLANTVAIALVTFGLAIVVLAWFVGERRARREKAPASAGLKAIEARLLAQREAPVRR